MGGLEKDTERLYSKRKGLLQSSLGERKHLAARGRQGLRSQQGQEGDKRALEVTGRRVREAAAGIVAEMFRLLLGPSTTIRGEGTRRRRLKRAQLFRTEAFGAE
jgi:hypothetical protein